MIYEYFIIFISVLIVYTTYDPPSADPSLLWVRWACAAALFLIYGLSAVAFYARLRRLASETGSESVRKSFRRSQGGFAVLALIAFMITVYVVNIKADLTSLPGSRVVPTLVDLPAVLLFLMYLATAWWFAYPVARSISRVRLSRIRYVMSKVRVYGSVLMPWLLLSLAADFLERIPFNPIRNLSPLIREIIFYGIFVLLFSIVAPLLIRYLWGLEPLAGGHARNLIENACRTSRFRVRDIMLWPLFDWEMITAGVMGLVGRYRYILVSPSLLSILDDDELVGVVAHEIGHVKKKHMFYYLLFLMGYLVISYPLFNLLLLLLPRVDFIADAMIVGAEDGGTMLSLVATLPLLLGFLAYFRFVFGFFMRSFERQADLFSLNWTGTPGPLVGSLRKISFFSGVSLHSPSWHHYGIGERIEALQRAAAEPGLIRAHDKRVKRSLVLFLVVVSAMGGAGYAFEGSALQARMQRETAENLLVRFAERNPDSAEALATLGAYYHDAKDYARAETYYLKALSESPEDAETLNNLAWLYATAEDKVFFRPEEALKWARKAAELKPVPHILDTLAESLYRAGKFEEAVEVGKKALFLAQRDASYFEGQLTKFEKALAANGKSQRAGSAGAQEEGGSSEH